MKKCELCDKRFPPKRVTAVYCSVECQQRTYRRRQRRRGPMSPEREQALDELLTRHEWELFAGETLR